MAYDRETVRALLALMPAEGSDFYHNEPNDYGVITMKLMVEGDPHRFRGAELQSRFYDGVRGNGHYHLNEHGIDEIMKLLEEAKERNNG